MIGPPHKERAASLIGLLADEARASGAVSVVVNRDGRLYGANTDVAGVRAGRVVVEAAAVAAPDAVRGSIVKAFVVVRDGWTPSDALARELQEHVKRVTAPYKYPRAIEFTKELPKTVSGKIRRV